MMAMIATGIAFSIPAALQGSYTFLMAQLTYMASYILLTFIYCPEVLGMDVDLAAWFKHRKQLVILLVYSAITIFYVVGFGTLFYQMSVDPMNPNAFSYSFEGERTVGTFVYYSIVTFTTIGYGDIAPLSRAARFLTGFEAMLGMIINVVFISILLIFISSFQGQAQKKEVEEIEREEAMISREEKELKKAEKEIIQFEEKEEKDIHSLLKEIRNIKK